MGYVFKEKVTLKQYREFINKQTKLSFMQEDNWAKVKNYVNYLIVGVMKEKELCAISLIIIDKHKGSTRFYIPNGFVLDFTNKELLSFMTRNIRNLAHKYHAYIVDIYPNITNIDQNYNEIHNNLIGNGYKWHNRYLDRSDNVLIDMKKSKKELSKNILTNDKKQDYYIKRGISFRVSQNVDDARCIADFIHKDYCNFELIANMIYQFQERIKIVIASIDLVFYLNFLNESGASNDEITNIKELILSQGESMDIGCELVILPISKKNTICEVIYHSIKDLGVDLKISDGLINTASAIAKESKCQYLKVSNINLDYNYYINKYNAIKLQYIGEYSIITNKLIYFLNIDIINRKA